MAPGSPALPAIQRRLCWPHCFVRFQAAWQHTPSDLLKHERAKKIAGKQQREKAAKIAVQHSKLTDTGHSIEMSQSVRKKASSRFGKIANGFKQAAKKVKKAVPPW